MPGGGGGNCLFPLAQRTQSLSPKSQPWIALLFYIRLYFNIRNSKVLLNTLCFFVVYLLQRNGKESSNRVHVEIYIKQKKLFLFFTILLRYFCLSQFPQINYHWMGTEKLPGMCHLEIVSYFLVQEIVCGKQ